VPVDEIEFRRRSLLRRAGVEAQFLARTRAEVVPPPGDEQAMVLWQAVQHLPPRQRAVLVLRFHEDLTEAESPASSACPGHGQVPGPPRPGPTSVAPLTGSSATGLAAAGTGQAAGPGRAGGAGPGARFRAADSLRLGGGDHRPRRAGTGALTRGPASAMMATTPAARSRSAMVMSPPVP
jgi:hypothetical protein